MTTSGPNCEEMLQDSRVPFSPISLFTSSGQISSASSAHSVSQTRPLLNMPANVALSVSFCFAFSVLSLFKKTLMRVSPGASSAAREISLLTVPTHRGGGGFTAGRAKVAKLSAVHMRVRVGHVGT